MTNRPQRILVVGDDDICTAPYAAAVLRAELRGRADLQVMSAGLDGSIGQPACAVAVARAPGGTDLRRRRSVPMNGELVRTADLVVTIDVEQRSLVNRLAPGCQSRVFTLREASTIARASTDCAGNEAIADVAEHLHRNRGLLKPKRIGIPRRGLLRHPVVALGLDDLPEAHGLEADAHAWALAEARTAAIGLGLALRRLHPGVASAA